VVRPASRSARNRAGFMGFLWGSAGGRYKNEGRDVTEFV